MSLFPFPPQELFNKMVPVISRLVGIAFMVGGALELLIIPFLFLGEGENITVFAIILFVSAVFSIGVGIVVLKYMPGLMLSISQKIRENDNG